MLMVRRQILGLKIRIYPIVDFINVRMLQAARVSIPSIVDEIRECFHAKITAPSINNM
jgi:hypothetical protein